jgi:hypothetical protein
MPTVDLVTRANLFPAERFVVQAAAPSFIASNVASFLSDHLPKNDTMIREINGLSMVSQRPMFVTKGPCVLISLSLSLDWLPCVQRVLSLAQGAAQLCQRNVLQLANTFSRNAETFTDVFQRLWFSAVETETLRDDFLLPAVEYCD